MKNNICQGKNRLPKLIVVLGPTASGKSDLAVALARKFNGEIISADSRQVYRGMDIGTGKIAKKEMQGISHYLLDVADPKRRFTVAQYKKLALQAIKKIQRKNKIPIICGGTGFYIQALVDNIPIPEVRPDLKLRAKLEKKTTCELFNELCKLDPDRAATIDQHNPRRLIRALEIIYKTGRPVPSIGVIPAKAGIQVKIPASAGMATGSRVKPGMTNSEFNTLFLGIKKSATELKKLIHKRLLKRFAQGMIKEVENLRNSGVSWKRLDSFGLEYRWIVKYLQQSEKLSFRVPRSGTRNLPALCGATQSRVRERSLPRQGGVGMTKKKLYNEMLARLQKEIEHYAKRQMTWFKRNKRIKWVSNNNQTQKLTEKFLK